MLKENVQVSAIMAEEYTIPIAVVWNGCSFDVERILESNGNDRFTCLVNGLERRLIYESEAWYEELS